MTNAAGETLHPIPLSPAEERFLKGFPGTFARFSDPDGRNHYLYRWVTQPTRKLHSSRDCLRGLGYRVGEAHLDGAWACFSARQGRTRWKARERIRESSGSKSWSTVSAWYWQAVLGRSKGPWLAETVLELR